MTIPIINQIPFESMKDKEEILDKVQIASPEIYSQIPKLVLRKKLSKLRHLVIKGGILPSYLDNLFPEILQNFDPQVVNYNGGVANLKEWKISCYLEVMEGGIPCTNPNIKLRECCLDLLDTCNDLFIHWYRQQHSCNSKNLGRNNSMKPERLMTFITRYTPAPDEQALLKVCHY